MSLLREQYQDLLNEIVAERNHSSNLAWSITIALAERDDALWTLERVNGRAQMADFDMGYVETSKALRDIRVWCIEALTPRADGGRG